MIPPHDPDLEAEGLDLAMRYEEALGAARSFFSTPFLDYSEADWYETDRRLAGALWLARNELGAWILRHGPAETGRATYFLDERGALRRRAHVHDIVRAEQWN